MLREMRLPCRELAEQRIREWREGEGVQRIEELGKGECRKLLRQTFHEVAIALQGVKAGFEAERGGIWGLYLGPQYEYVRLVALGDPMVCAERDVSTACIKDLSSGLTFKFRRLKFPFHYLSTGLMDSRRPKLQLNVDHQMHPTVLKVPSELTGYSMLEAGWPSLYWRSAKLPMLGL